MINELGHGQTCFTWSKYASASLEESRLYRPLERARFRVAWEYKSQAPIIYQIKTAISQKKLTRVGVAPYIAMCKIRLILSSSRV
jgi:hypothetical protein